MANFSRIGPIPASVILVYKSLNDLAPPYMAGMFQYVKDTERNNLRSTTDDKLFVPRVHPKSIRYSGPRVWNKLKPEVRRSESLAQFKLNYLKSESLTQTNP